MFGTAKLCASHMDRAAQGHAYFQKTIQQFAPHMLRAAPLCALHINETVELCAPHWV
jgi:hypothetical protein